LTWFETGPTDGVEIERTTVASLAACDTATDFVRIATTDPDAESYIDAAVSRGVTYAYRVRAVRGADVSAYSNVACRTVPRPYCVKHPTATRCSTTP